MRCALASQGHQVAILLESAAHALYASKHTIQASRCPVLATFRSHGAEDKNSYACSSIRDDTQTRCICSATVHMLQKRELKESPVQHAGGCRGSCVLLRLLCQPALHNIHLETPKTTSGKSIWIQGASTWQMCIVLQCSTGNLPQPRLQVHKGWGPTTMYTTLSSPTSGYPCTFRTQEWCKLWLQSMSPLVSIHRHVSKSGCSKQDSVILLTAGNKHDRPQIWCQQREGSC